MALKVYAILYFVYNVYRLMSPLLSIFEQENTDSKVCIPPSVLSFFLQIFGLKFCIHSGLLQRSWSGLWKGTIKQQGCSTVLARRFSNSPLFKIAFSVSVVSGIELFIITIMMNGFRGAFYGFWAVDQGEPSLTVRCRERWDMLYPVEGYTN